MGAGMGLLFVSTGLIGGMSTVFTSVWSYFSRAPFFQEGRFVSSRRWHLVYAAALVGGAFIWLACCGEPFVTGVPAWQLVLGGFVAGFGARLSNGCTAGHGICGMASLQPASILSVLLFLATAMITARIVATFA
jgi:uncharacterized membrane protein YedE/YeeE